MENISYAKYLIVFYLLHYLHGTEIQHGNFLENISSPLRYQWKYINFTWPSKASYQQAFHSGFYIPENNIPAGLKFYKNKVYLALPRSRKGSPVTLGSFHVQTPNKITVLSDILLEPFPSWSQNVKPDCSTLQNVMSMDIDRNGIMWVMDGNRMNNLTKCPTKIILYDLNRNNRVVAHHTFPPEICLFEGGFLNDLVIDETDGGYAYITDASTIDPGLIVFSLKQKRSWKLRDATMFPELDASNFILDGVLFKALVPINGIALSPVNSNINEGRTLYYSALSAFNMYAINTKVLQDETFCKSDKWRSYVQHVGRKSTIGGGMMMDNQGNLFYGLIQTRGIGTWNIHENFSTARAIVNNNPDMIWTDSFGIDNYGYVYILCNEMHKFGDLNRPIINDGRFKYRIFGFYTGTKSYVY